MGDDVVVVGVAVDVVCVIGVVEDRPLRKPLLRGRISSSCGLEFLMCALALGCSVVCVAVLVDMCTGVTGQRRV